MFSERFKESDIGMLCLRTCTFSLPGMPGGNPDQKLVKEVEQKLLCSRLNKLPIGSKVHLCRTGLLSDLGKPDFHPPYEKISHRTLKNHRGRTVSLDFPTARVWLVVGQKDVEIDQSVANVEA